MLDVQNLLTVLENNPSVHVTQGIVFPGAEEQMVFEIEKELGAQLHPTIRNFYLKHNGVSIQWIHKDKANFEEADCPRDDSEFPYVMDLLEDYGPPLDGQLVLLPLEDVFVSSFEARGNVADCGAEAAFVEYLRDVPEKTVSQASEVELRSQLRLFEIFLRDSLTGMRYEKGRSDPDVHYLPNRWRNIDPNQKLPLSTYLQMVVQNFGLRWGRHQYFDGTTKLLPEIDPAKHLANLLKLC